MSRFQWITPRAIGALTAIGALGAVSESCVGKGDSAPSGAAVDALMAPAPADPIGVCGSGAPGFPYGASGTGKNGYSQYKNVFWGNLHQHTAYSLDAYTWGAQTSSQPANAYAFADGFNGSTLGNVYPGAPESATDEYAPSMQVGGPSGKYIYPQQTLDFLAITDHSEWMSLNYDVLFANGSPSLLDFPSVTYAAQTTAGVCGAVSDWPYGTPMDPSDPCAGTKGYYESAWNNLIAAAYNAYSPCTFTSLVAYEWTGMSGGLPQNDNPNLMGGVTNHRNVIFNNGTAASLPAAPCDSLYCAPSPALLWSALDTGCAGQDVGCDAVTLPHNTNESGGQSLLAPVGAFGTEAWSDQVHYQVSAEIYQHKGNSECYQGTYTGQSFGAGVYAGGNTTPGVYSGDTGIAGCGFEKAVSSGDQPLSYVRGGLEYGTSEAAQQGIGMQGDPFQLGIVGATDDHNAAPGYVEEEVFVGHHGSTDDTPADRVTNWWTYSPGGLTGVWAEQNTRDRIFAAIQRRETFATSGPRVQVRFYQYNAANPAITPCGTNNVPTPTNLVENGAVPMGGTFGQANLGASAGNPAQDPSFVIQVTSDPHAQVPSPATTCTSESDCMSLGADFDCNTTLGVCAGPVGLSEVQVIKGYSQKTGSGVVTKEDTISHIPLQAGQSCVTWADTSTYNPADYAFYYVRVLQAPTYRWSHWDCATLKAKNPSNWQTLYPNCVSPTNDTIQERAWSSPIWYSPDLQYSVVAGTGVLGDDPPGAPPPSCSALGQACSSSASCCSGNCYTNPATSSSSCAALSATSTSPQVELGGQPGNNYLSGMAKDAAGNLYIADAGSAVIRKVDTSGFISVFAGKGTPGPAAAVGVGTPATQATLNGPSGVAVDSHGNVYFSEFNNNDVRVVDSTGTIWTYAGLAGQPTGISIDGSNNIYVAMWARPTIVKLSWSGIWTPGSAPSAPGNARWAGTVGSPGYNPGEATGGATPLASVLFNNPNGVWADTFGNVYVNDSGNAVIRMYSGVATSKTYGKFTTIAGVKALGPGPIPAVPPSALPQNVPATSVQINSLYGVVADALGNVFIADTNNNAIRMIDPAGNIHTLTPGNGGDPVYPAYGGSLSPTAWTPSGAAANLLLSQPGYSWMDSGGAMYFSDLTDNVYKLGLH